MMSQKKMETSETEAEATAGTGTVRYRPKAQVLVHSRLGRTGWDGLCPQN